MLVGVPALTGTAWAAPTVASVTGEVERLTLNDPANVWSGGTVVVGGQVIILPKNLLIDLPANRLTLQQIFAQAPAACLARSESGLGKADGCNTWGTGATATISANRTNGGNVIAGDVYLQKGVDLVNGTITYADYHDGYFRLNGLTGDPTTGVMVRLNDPIGRHTVQQGLGCGSTPNCSPDPRFGLDADNYTSSFTTGYPLCLPSTTTRTFPDVLDLNGNGNVTEQLSTASDASGKGDALCPDTNRPDSNVAADSRRLAPIRPGDSVIVKGNFETVNGIRFLSAYSTKVSVALSTSSDPGQPDYMVLNDMFIDAPSFARLRIRDQFDGATTEADSDVLLWSVHRDPAANRPHEFPLGTVVGCENAAGPLTCRRVLGPNTFRIRHEAVFAAGGAKVPKLDACMQLRSDDRFAATNPCPASGITREEFAVLSPIPHEVQARTGLKEADLQQPGGPTLKTVDVHGNDAPNGQFLFPMGIGLGGIEPPNFAEIDINKINTPISFDGEPWNLDRRLSPGGCVGPCEAAPQPLDPFPYSGLDPRDQAPTDPYWDPTFDASDGLATANRILSYVDPTIGKPNGNATLLAWPPVDPPTIPLSPTPATTDAKALITGMTPDTGAIGTTVLIDGTGLSGTTAVTFGGVRAATFTNISNNEISAVVPPGAVTGPIGVTTPTGTVSGATRFTVIPPPAVTGFSPATGPVGTGVLVTGSALNTTTAATVNGSAASFTIVSDTAVRVVVPGMATTGPIALTTAGGTATTATSYTVGGMAPTPAVTLVAPTAAPVGATVTINGSGFTGATSVAFGGISDPTFAVAANGNSITAHVPTGATTGAVTVTGAGGTASSPTPFTVAVPVQPIVSGLSPSNGPPGTAVTITGSGLTGATAVRFNGTPATFTLISDSMITTTVPSGSTTGSVTVTTPVNTASSASTFQVTAPPPPPPVPAITAISPTSGPVGTSVTINGSGFSGTTAVTFNGTAAGYQVASTGATITTTVPAGATTGVIAVTTPGGIAKSPTFTVTATPPAPKNPVITSFTPNKGNSGTKVTITGANFTGTTAVSVKGTPARSYTVVSPTQITFVVGTGTKTGPISVTANGLIGTSSTTFTIAGKAL
jgi:hypothetical protein